MKVVKTPGEVRKVIAGFKKNCKNIALVPTMGDLHRGHISLIEMALEKCDRVVVSIFVNPKQFGPKEDYSRYPRNEQSDKAILEELGCDLLFVPSVRDLYSASDRTRVSVEKITGRLCGLFRPGHFDGVTLVVSKLFNIVDPDMAFFGQKDAQQAVVIQRMSADLNFPVRIVLGPIIREDNGLALSSRNRYLDDNEMIRAASLYKSLSEAFSSIKMGERNPDRIASRMRSIIENAGLQVEYAEIVDGKTMEAVSRIENVILVAVAARLGDVRLIDNIAVKIEDDSVEEVLLEFPNWSSYE
ncbi:MAG: pantoate--beta-alanine ligase [Candidatus Krumholzibacteriota bacterium]|nr:pantoate--beta-alanine ligase [Candidatus Krumholzibacteriota bacterium]